MEIREFALLDHALPVVWRLVGRFDGIADWLPGITDLRCEGQGIGCVRSFQLHGLAMREQLDHIDDVQCTIEYHVMDGPLAAAGYRGRIAVRGVDAGRSTVTWSGTLTRQDPSPRMLAAIREGLRTGMAALQQALNAGPAGPACA